MGKWCNFDTNDDGQLVCLEHSPVGAPALCAHAAADLERRVERAAAIEVDHDATYTARVADLEPRLTRLEEEKAQLQAKAFDWQEQWKITSNHLTQAETREAAVREVAKAADKVMRDWELACRDHPVNYAKPETLHPFGPAIGWQSLHALRNALAKREEEGE